MNRSKLAPMLWVLICACNPQGPLSPRLCVSSLTAGTTEMPCEIDGGQATSAELTAGAPILVQHVLPRGVDPQDNEVRIDVVSPGIEEQRLLGYGKAPNGEALATTVFEFPDAGDCFVSVSANILNSQLTVTSHGAACP